MFEILVILFLASLAALTVLVLVWIVFGILYLIRRQTPPRMVSYVTLVVALIALATYAFPVRPFTLRGRQVRTLANMQIIEELLDKFQHSHGHFPRELSSAFESAPYSHLQDGWGNSFYFESRGNSYILAGLGSDGELDDSNYWKLRSFDAPAQSVQGNWSADQVLSDKGWHRQAGK